MTVYAIGEAVEIRTILGDWLAGSVSKITARTVYVRIEQPRNGSYEIPVEHVDVASRIRRPQAQP